MAREASFENYAPGCTLALFMGIYNARALFVTIKIPRLYFPLWSYTLRTLRSLVRGGETHQREEGPGTDRYIQAGGQNQAVG